MSDDISLAEKVKKAIKEIDPQKEEERIKKILEKKVSDMTLAEKIDVMDHAMHRLPYRNSDLRIRLKLEQLLPGLKLDEETSNQYAEAVLEYRASVAEQIGNYLGLTKDVLVAHMAEQLKQRSYIELFNEICGPVRYLSPEEASQPEDKPE